MDGIDIKSEYISKTIARLQTIAEIRALGIDVSDAYRKKVELDYEGLPNADVIPLPPIYKAGYGGKVARFRVNGRLFEIRELAQ